MKTTLPFEQAHRIASKLVDRFAANCERIELAGSVRRRKATIGDIEIIAVPTEALYAQLDDLLATGKIRHREPRKAWGKKLRSFLVDVGGASVQVDMFLQPDPATWGVNYMIRTGNSDFSHCMVTKRSMGGWMPDAYQVGGARVWSDGQTLPTPEEPDVFRLWGMEFVPPELRTGDYVPTFVVQPAVRPPAVVLSGESADWPLPDICGKGRQAAGDMARAAIEESERLRLAGLLKPTKPRPETEQEFTWTGGDDADE